MNIDNIYESKSKTIMTKIKKLFINLAAGAAYAIRN